MKIIEKKSVVPLPKVSGSISDTLQVEDKVLNAPSINLVQQMTGIPVDGIIEFDGTEDEIPEGYEKAESAFFEEGTWTPQLKCDGETAPTYSVTGASGEYFKLGKIVFISFSIRGNITKLNGTNNYTKITNLPFKSGTTMSYALSVGDVYGLTQDTSGYALDIYNSDIRVKKIDGSSHRFKVTTEIYFDIRATGWYACIEE